MNKLKRINIKLLIVLSLSLVISACIGLIFLRPNSTAVYAATESSALTFTTTSDTECAVRLSDKTVTKAIIPSTAEINGKEYTVTSIATNGFASASKLEKVRLPKTIKKIGQSAFSNCKALKSITLTEVESIGANAFAMTKLDHLIIPETVTTVAGNILRNTSTQVYVRAELPENATLPEGNWASNWNAYNSNQDVHFGSDYVPPIKYIHSSEAAALSGISLFGFTEQGYIVDAEQEFTDKTYNQIIVPTTYKNEPVIGIDSYAFVDNKVDKIKVEYSEEPINIKSSAFDACESLSVIINRPITLIDEDGEDGVSMNAFANSLIKTLILPDSINLIGPYMFANNTVLDNIHFINPHVLTSEEEKNLIEKDTNEVFLPDSITTICDEAFSDISLIKILHIPQVENVGRNILVDWSADNDQKVYIDFDEDKINDHQWDTAWSEGCDENIIEFKSTTEYKIIYHNNGGTHNNPKTITRKQEMTLENAERKGYLFKGWYKTSDCTGDIITVIPKGTSEDIELFAKFEAIQYTIRYDSNKPVNASDEVTGITRNSTHYYDEEDYINNNGYKLKGWEFIDWVFEETGIHYANAEPVSNLTDVNGATVILKAQWNPIEYTLVYAKNRPEGTSAIVSGEMNSEKLTYDQDHTLANVEYTLPGFSFAGWKTEQGVNYENCAPVKNLTTVDGATVTLYAQWDEGEFRVEYKPNKPVQANEVAVNVSGTMNNSTFTYDSGVVLTANAFELTGWDFKEWNTEPDGSGEVYANESTIINKSSNITLYAQWQIIEYDIIYEAYEGVNPESNPNKYTILDEVVFAVPELRGHYGQWNIHSIQKGSTGIKELIASYSLRKYEISYNCNGG